MFRLVNVIAFIDMNNKMSINSAFGQILASYRKLKDLSQEDFEGTAHRTYISDLERGLKSPTLEMIAKLTAKLEIHPTEMVAQTFALWEKGSSENLESSLDYLVNNSESLDLSYNKIGQTFTVSQVKESVILTNTTIVTLAMIFQQIVGVDLFEVIDKKQTGAFLGSIFVSNFANIANDQLAKNPSQTGHPDLIPQQYRHDQSIKNWDQFSYGGVEVKTNCGNLKNGVTNNLDIGEPRISYLTGLDWKGHHQYINNLLGLFWDYFKGRATVLAAFYSNELVPDDFSNTVPKEGGGRTTSVCVTKKTARDKLMKNWILLPNNSQYLDFFARRGTILR